MKKVVSLLISLVMLLSALPLMLNFASAAVKTGDVIEFGSYPQTKVSDSATVKKLDSAAKNWKSYGYYWGQGSEDDGQMRAETYMKYSDINVGGVSYRAVTFSVFRPFSTGRSGLDGETFQKVNGYNKNTVYYFRYEPLRWRILDASNGLVMCENIIDAQAYNSYILASGNEHWGDSKKSHYANNYYFSSLRKWLNEDFFNTAFSAADKNNVKSTSLDNSAYSKNVKRFDSQSSNDKVFLLSYSDVKNKSYGFSSNKERLAKGTDYAKCQGLWVCDEGSAKGYSGWRLRTASNLSVTDCFVFDDGSYDSTDIFAYDTSGGIRPACTLSKLTAGSSFKLGDIDNDGNVNSADALLALQCSVGRTTLTGDRFKAADVNRDNTINSADALLILEYSVNKISSFN